MREPGQIALLRFPQVDLSIGKIRPVLLIARLPGRFEDWLVCMLSTQLHHALPGLDEVLDESQADFSEAGVKVASIVRVTRLAVASAEMLIGATGHISQERLMRIKDTLSTWIKS